jgi:hypothetical protein
MPEKFAVYVDGFNLYHGLHDTSGRKHLWLEPDGRWRWRRMGVAVDRDLAPSNTLGQVEYRSATCGSTQLERDLENSLIAVAFARRPAPGLRRCSVPRLVLHPEILLYTDSLKSASPPSG